MLKAIGFLLFAGAAWYLVDAYVVTGSAAGPDDGERTTTAQRAGAAVERSLREGAERYSTLESD